MYMFITNIESEKTEGVCERASYEKDVLGSSWTMDDDASGIFRTDDDDDEDSSLNTRRMAVKQDGQRTEGDRRERQGGGVIYYVVLCCTNRIEWIKNEAYDMTIDQSKTLHRQQSRINQQNQRD
jgi:hypothetical protein